MPSFTYQFTPSSTNSSPDISRFSLECNFEQLACEYPEFKCEFDRLKKRRRKEDSDADNNRNLTRVSANARTQGNQSDNEQTHDVQDNRLESKSTYSFSSEVNHSFNAALTRALLQKHFGLNMPSLPEGRLCPPVPNRCNYVAWLKQLMLRNSMDLYRFGKAGGISSQDLQYKGIDLGTGVSVIYPLLLSTELFAKCNELNRGQRNKWKFLATDIDSIAIESARQNVNANNLQEEICVALVTEEESTTSSIGDVAKGPLFTAMKVAKEEDMFKQINPAAKQENGHDDDSYPKFDFCMTNPPFYESVDEVTAPRAGDKRSRTDMSINEGLYQPVDASSQGGDVGFVKSIIQESTFFRNRVTWYTSLIAKRSSLDAIYQKLQTVEGIWGNRGQIRTVEFRQDNANSENSDGKRKDHNYRVRWGIAWTFERAVGRVASCRLRGGLQSFVVSIPIHGDATDAINEVSSRLRVYYNEMRDLTLKCTDEYRERNNDAISNERTKERCVTVTEERFSGHTGVPTSSNDQDNRNLPREGHFIMDAFISISQSCSDSVDVDVNLEAYAHTKHGIALVNKIRSQLTGEIGRTNRRWRRLLKRRLASSSSISTHSKIL